MPDLALTKKLFFDQNGLNEEKLRRIVQDTLHGCDDGELYLEYSLSEHVGWDDGRIRSAGSDQTQGFGIRAVAGDAFSYAHATELSQAAILRACDAAKAIKSGHSGTMSATPQGTNRLLYPEDNPLGAMDFAKKVKLLEQIDAYARAKDNRVRQVTASLSGEWKVVCILRPDAPLITDIRPLVRLNVSVVVEKGDRQESGSDGAGGRCNYDFLVTEDNWQSQTDEALRQALVNLESIPAPAGEMTVVLGPGWPGILLHEAVGHGLEGDFNRKKTSAYSGLMGQRVAAKGVTIVDDGTIEGRRGSITIDDEGTPSSSTTLIEDGILKGYMQDRLNARLMGVSPTGNGRRQDFANPPLPRMTNTYMMAGEHDPEEILKSVKNGVYAVNFGGGQVDITSGKFVFSASEAYLIEDGKPTTPIKGATLIGNGFDAMNKITMIGTDMKLDPGIGTCGKDGQGVPVGVGQPTLRMDGLTVGGTG